MKTVFFVLLTLCIQGIFSFPQNKIPKGSLIVAKDGSGDYDTVQAAVNALDNSATAERVIFLKSGTYVEQVTIEKDYITLIGENKDNVKITYDLNNNRTGSSFECATVKAKGDYFKAFDITFENTAPFPIDNPQAPAIYNGGNKHYIENCNFLSYQDTLLSHGGSAHYFKNCYIMGVVDFIWGNGRAAFENCLIHVVKHGRVEGYLTANGNQDPEYKKGGFLITKSTVKADVKYYLGRLWKEYCYVIFDKTELPGDQLMEVGWLTFKNKDDYIYTSKFGEFECHGENYTTTGRSELETKFTSVPTIEEFLGGDISFASESVYFKKDPVNPPAPKTTTIAAEPTSNATKCKPLYSQCGGQFYKGSKCCESGKCKKFSKYYSQCIPKQRY